MVERLLAAGAILLGKTNTPELTLFYDTDNLLFGKTFNPYDLTRSPGGSSGGSAAIVAAAGAAFNLGSDTQYPSIRSLLRYCWAQAHRRSDTPHWADCAMGYARRSTPMQPYPS